MRRMRLRDDGEQVQVHIAEWYFKDSDLPLSSTAFMLPLSFHPPLALRLLLDVCVTGLPLLGSFWKWALFAVFRDVHGFRHIHPQLQVLSEKIWLSIFRQTRVSPKSHLQRHWEWKEEGIDSDGLGEREKLRTVLSSLPFCIILVILVTSLPVFQNHCLLGSWIVCLEQSWGDICHSSVSDSISDYIASIVRVCEYIQ